MVKSFVAADEDSVDVVFFVVGSRKRRHWLHPRHLCRPQARCHRDNDQCRHIHLKRKTQAELRLHGRQCNAQKKNERAAFPRCTRTAILLLTEHHYVWPFCNRKKCKIPSLKIMMIVPVHQCETRLLFYCHTRI